MKIGFLYALAASVTWGLIYALDQKILVRTTPINLLFVGSVISLVALSPILITNSPFTELIKSGKANVYLFIFNSLLNLLAAWFIYSGIKSVGASAASILEIAYPFFVILFSFFLYGQTLTPAFMLGGAFIFIGAFIITRYS